MKGNVRIENEEQLVRNLSKGSILAFNTLFRFYSGKLYRFINGYLRSPEESEEVVQEVFLTLWEKRTELKDELSLRSYLFTIAFNVVKKHFRSKSYLKKYLDSGLWSDINMDTTGTIDYDSVYSFIKDLIESLPERRKEIFIRSRFEGMSIAEIAQELGISHKTVENQITAALKFLRQNLDREFFPVLLFLYLFVF